MSDDEYSTSSSDSGEVQNCMELIPTKEEGGYSFIDLQKSFKAMVPQLDGANWHLWYSRLRGLLCFIPNGMDYIQDDDFGPSDPGFNHAW